MTSYRSHDISHDQHFDCLSLNMSRLTTKNQRPALLTLCEGNPSMTDWCPSKRSVLWKAFPCHDVNMISLLWRHNGHDGVSNHQPHDCLLNRLFRRRSMKTSKLRVTGLCAGNSPGTGEFPAQMASNAENVSIWWRHHVECSIFPRYIIVLQHFFVHFWCFVDAGHVERLKIVTIYRMHMYVIWNSRLGLKL